VQQLLTVVQERLVVLRLDVEVVEEVVRQVQERLVVLVQHQLRQQVVLVVRHQQVELMVVKVETVFWEVRDLRVTPEPQVEVVEVVEVQQVEHRTTEPEVPVVMEKLQYLGHQQPM
jgi:hypothetical protein